ncbi:magnesium transporter [Phreatobacter sp. AB_2022a]|uniref:magnesium transporter n=1 Tax=Phreatobacter sp. AB_2022a TaxID=3003134 RepID=UPI0022872E64|nr:magnesium transporter [Phreatobacter sp. AB_2022a]MCZ0735366.1 magnesium transporter [Phreatobacter sp. AB_2022a]
MADSTPQPTLPEDWRDDDGALRPEIVETVAEAIAKSDASALKDMVGEAHEADLGDLIAQLDAEDRRRLIELLGTDFDFAALTEVDETIRIEILEELPAETVAEGIAELDSDDAVSLLQDLDEEDRSEILDKMPPVERVALKRALDYPEDSAGRRMKDDFIAVPPFWTVGQVIDHLREAEDLPDDFTEIFVIDPGFRLQGHIRLDRLLRTKRPVTVTDIMEEEVRTVEATEDQQDVALMFERYNLLSAAVVDDAGRLVGVLTVDDIVDVIEEEADADIKALGGVKPEEEISDSVWTTAKGRFRWLFINMLTAFIATSVLKSFEKQMESMVALAVLAPIVASQGGNAATQTMTVAVRALATHDLGPHNAWRVIGREALTGLINGSAFALIVGVVAGFWFSLADLGIVIGLAMVCNLVAGGLAGILIPLGLSKLDADPAVSSGPFVTTVTDVVGFLGFLTIASWWFKI